MCYPLSTKLPELLRGSSSEKLKEYYARDKLVSGNKLGWVGFVFLSKLNELKISQTELNCLLNGLENFDIHPFYSQTC